MPYRARFCLLLPALLLAGTRPARAQECPSGRIGYVFVDNHSIFDTSEMDPKASFRWAYDLANALHMETRASFIRKELLFHQGDCYDPLLLEESARILRNYVFMARVDVYDVPQPDGSHDVVVDTQDEWTTQLTVGVAVDRGFKLEKAELYEDDFLGRGMLLGVFYEGKQERRDLGVIFQTPRLFSTRWDATISGGRTRVGTFLTQGFDYPFVSELGRVAARELYSRREVLFPYSVEGEPGFDRVFLSYRKESTEVTAAARLGRPGNLTVFGMGFLRETMAFGSFPGGVDISPNGSYSDRVPAGPAQIDAIAGQIRPTTIFRVNFLLGQRNIRYAQRTGLDALDGTQDVRIGTETNVTIGRSLGDVASGSRSSPDDLYLRFHQFAGWAPGRWVIAANANVEGRLVFQSAPVGNNFRDILGDADLYAYWKPPRPSRQTFFARISGAGGWSVLRPFQLTLGGATSVRGFSQYDFPGGRRVLVSMEDRIRFRWPAPDLFDFGATVFGDAGRMWAGDVPYGRTSPWQASVGGGFRIGFPAGTRTVARIDLAVPVTGSRRFSSPTFRISLHEQLGLTPGFSDEEIVRSRRPEVGTDLLAAEGR